MSANLNKVILLGNLTRDPELKFLQSGTAVCNLGMAINRKWKDAGGQDKEEVTFVDVVAWGKQAEACGEYLKKGAPVLVEGRLQFQQWEHEGMKRSKLQVISERVQFLGGKPKTEGAPASEGQPQQSPADTGDDIPF